MKQKSLMIALCGGSGSGKTTIVEKVVGNILATLPAIKITVLHQDHYYKDLSHLSPEERSRVNFDHPDSIDSDLLLKQLTELAWGRSIKRPTYDFVTHTRSQSIEILESSEIIIFDGIFSLFYESLRALFDLKIFVDVDSDLRFIRRLKRDLVSRGRTMDQVVVQYLENVHPMHKLFIEPSKDYADDVILWNEMDLSKIESLKTKIISMLL